ncbi:uncharacterized protein LOC117183075 [Belonocnema kinseyi]|uniref:uncharacterized protein LOC117183075 n=1 Tax=Belonocnema kinseyi TaxID=2817044 RepID=UPI00143CD433|nr:uncharacterized protein LOC117183075 [Belonocnema kinseyi]
MRTLHTLVLLLAIVLNFIEFSSQFDCLPNGDPISPVPRCRNLSSSVKHEPPESSLPLAEFPLRARSRSPSGSYSNPPVRYPALSILGREPEELRFLRLVPNTNPHHRFEIQIYTFPANKLIQMKDRNSNLVSMPTDERNVLTTSTGDVVAIVEGNNRLRGIYVKRRDDCYIKRVKINKKSGNVKEMTLKEIAESPLGNKNPITKNFGIINVSDIPPSHLFNKSNVNILHHIVDNPK